MSIPLSLPFYCFYPFLCLCLHMPIYFYFSLSLHPSHLDPLINVFLSLPSPLFQWRIFPSSCLKYAYYYCSKRKQHFIPIIYSLFFACFFSIPCFFFLFLLRLQSFISSCSSSIRCVFPPFSLFLYSVPVSFSIVRLISLDEGRQIRRDLKLQKYEKKPFHSCYFFPNSFLSLFPSLHFPMLIFAFFSEAVFLASLQILQEWKGLELSPFFALYEKFWSQHHWITLKFEFMWRFCANRRRAMGIYVILLFCLVHLLCFLFIVLLREPSKEEGSNLSVFPFLRTCDLFQGWECFAFRPIIY